MTFKIKCDNCGHEQVLGGANDKGELIKFGLNRYVDYAYTIGIQCDNNECNNNIEVEIEY